MKQDIKDFVSQKCRYKYYKLPGFLDAQNAKLFMMYEKANQASLLDKSNHFFLSSLEKTTPRLLV
jgi:hypothetical protein